ncbi:MAG: DUF4040 domain-containing protein, partial [Bacteroidales bacterium]|nr:DUF4040 domain-containing protein [Bacteroidales bacterium]
YMAITKTDLKAILAHTTISALGVLTMLIGIDTKFSIKAAILFLVIHSLYKATLFMIAGVIDKKAGTREISKLGGLFKRMPVAVSAALLALLSMSGLPPMIGFIGKELIYEAKVLAGDIGTVVLILGILSNVFMVWISGMLAYRAFFGPSRKELKKPMEPSLAILAGPVVFSVLSLLLGLFPGKFGELIVEPALIASRAEILNIKLKLWHGFNEVFFLSLATIVSGVILFFLSEKLIPVLRKINAAFFDYDFSGTFFKMIDGLLNFSRKKTSVIQHGYHRFYLMIIFIVAGLLILFQLTSIKGWAIPQHAGAIPFYLVITAVLIATSAIFVTITGSRMAAVVLLGVTGYGIALIYMFYGGIDLAITQLLIETLTVILFVLVIRRLPKFKTLSTLPSRIRDLLIALLIGFVMTGLTLKAGILNFREPISEFFVERSLPEGFGKNIVNVILVDFRALDTLGEITVLTVAAVGVWVLLKFKVKA